MSAPRIRVLAAAFAAVPGPGPESVAMLSMVDAIRGELDLVTMKTEELAHVKRIGDARMFRVPMGAASASEQRELYARAVGRQIEAEAYQVVHVLDPWAGVAAAERRRGFALVYECVTFPDAGAEAEWTRAHERTLAAADRVLVPTQAAARALEARGLSGRVEVVRPSVDVATFDWEEIPRFGTARLLYLGSFTARRDLDTLIAAAARVSALRPVRVLLAGDPDPDRRQRLRAEVIVAGLRDVIEVRGEPSERNMAALIAASDVCVAPASSATFAELAALPHPLLEYLACYRPVVAADVPGVSELIRDEVEGLLYPPGDAAALADAVLEVLRDAALRERLTEAGYRRARDQLGTGARRRRVLAIYEALVPGSQLVDPWRENFEEITGLIELPSALADVSREPETLPPSLEHGDDDDDGADTTETLAPARPPRRKRDILKTIQDLHPPTTDTNPGLPVPDTDPGR